MISENIKNHLIGGFAGPNLYYFHKNIINFESDITLQFKGRKYDAKKYFWLQGLKIYQDDIIEVSITGSDETEAFEKVKEMFSKSFLKY